MLAILPHVHQILSPISASKDVCAQHKRKKEKSGLLHLHEGLSELQLIKTAQTAIDLCSTHRGDRHIIFNQISGQSVCSHVCTFLYTDMRRIPQYYNVVFPTVSKKIYSSTLQHEFYLTGRLLFAIKLKRLTRKLPMKRKKVFNPIVLNHPLVQEHIPLPNPT